jgi:tetratricopeptide (TPR) repeat protein
MIMRTILALGVILGTVGAAGAQERLADQLRKSIAQEETARDPERAIQAYQAIVAQFDEDRQAAAIALYRLAECYRQAGRTEQANAAYRRVVREFPDQAAVAEPSRRELGGAAALDEKPTTSESAEEILRSRRTLSDAQRDLETSRVPDSTRDPRAILSTYSRTGDASSLDAARAELGRVESRMLDTERQVAAGQESQAVLQELRGQYSAAKARYEQLVAGRDSATASTADPRAGAGDALASVEKEIIVVKSRIGALEQRVAAGTLSRDDAELAQLRRDLTGLQQKAAELRKEPALP